VFPTCSLSNKIDSWLEKSVIKKADLVLFNVDRMRDVYKNAYASQPAEKFVCIPNGIDHRTFSNIRTSKKYEQFTLSYTGSLYVDRSPEPIFQALSRLLCEKKISLNEVRVKLIGQCRHVGHRPIASMINEYGLQSVVDVLDPVPYKNALEIIRQSHVALLFAPNQPYQVPAKVYDYLGAKVKILAIAEPGATSDFINAAGCGEVFSTSDIEGIKEFIIQAMHNGSTAEENYSAILSHYDAKRLTKSLSDNLNKLIDKNSHERKNKPYSP